MKGHKFLMFAAAALSLAACTKDVAPTTPDAPIFGKNTAYAKVKVSFGSTTTRANTTTDGGYVAGTTDESEVKDLTLVLFNEAGKVVGSGAIAPELTADEDDDNIESKGGTQILKITLDPGDEVPAKAIAYANLNVDAEGLTLEDAKKAVTVEKELYTLDNGKATRFAMSNSAYYDTKGEWQREVPVTEAHFFDTYDEAKATTDENKILSIHVERLAAKVTVENKATTTNVADYNFTDIDGNTYTIAFNAVKWGVTGKAKDMYTLKMNNDDTKLEWALANGDFRNYWANGVNYEQPYSAYLVGANKETLLNYLSANLLISDNSPMSNSFEDGAAYVTEHTFGVEAKVTEDDGGTSVGNFAPKITATNIMVAGRYKIAGVAKNGVTPSADKFKTTYGENNTEAWDFYLASRVGSVEGKTAYYIYNKADLIKYLLKRNDTAVSKTQGEEEALDDDDYLTYFDVEKNPTSGQYELKVKQTDDNVYTGTDWNTAINKAYESNFTQASNAKHYLNGWAYFMGPIKHHYVATDEETTTEATVGAYGVVRNHVYAMSITKFNGLGTPLDEGKIGEDPENTEPDPENPDPEDPGDEPIIPDPKEPKEAFISTTLKVLSWHSVSQDVEF